MALALLLGLYTPRAQFVVEHEAYERVLPSLDHEGMRNQEEAKGSKKEMMTT